jgi:hypothetical protein
MSSHSVFMKRKINTLIRHSNRNLPRAVLQLNFVKPHDTPLELFAQFEYLSDILLLYSFL